MKAQMSMEFLVFTGVLLVLTAFASYIAISTSHAVYTENSNREARMLAEKVASEINIAASVGPGYTHEFDLPAAVQGVPYSIHIAEQRVYISWANRSYSLPLLATVAGDPRPGTNTISNSGVVTLA